jgi:hypothetical protein
MTWIKTVEPDGADGELARVYREIYALYPPEYGVAVAPLLRPDGRSDSVTAAHSLIPEAMRHMMTGLAVLLRPDLPLSRTQQEMIASVVSVHNRCLY